MVTFPLSARSFASFHNSSGTLTPLGLAFDFNIGVVYSVYRHLSRLNFVLIYFRLWYTNYCGVLMVVQAFIFYLLELRPPRI